MAEKINNILRKSKTEGPIGVKWYFSLSLPAGTSLRASLSNA